MYMSNRRNKKDDNIIVTRKELLNIYDEAIKITQNKNILLYTVLYQKLDNSIKNDYEKWKNYKLICENYNFLEFNLSFVAIIISLVALVEVELGLIVMSVLTIGIILLSIMAILMHRRKKNYQYILGVLEDLKPQLGKKQNNK